MFGHITAVGDCNTLGANSLEGNSYPERIARRIGAEVTNLGHTMATSREGVLLLRDFLGKSDCILIQFGLADSYTTFKYAPYVLYYPDNFYRRPLRSLVKKLKKTCRKMGMNTLLGQKSVVSLEEYERNIRAMVEMAQPQTIFLIDTIPHKEVSRNTEIQRYNRVLDTIADEIEGCFKIDLYDVFAAELHRFYQDSTHCSDQGYDCITDIVCSKMQQLDDKR